MVREIWPREVPGLEVGKFSGVSRSDPQPRGGEGIMQRATEAYVWKVVSLTSARPL